MSKKKPNVILALKHSRVNDGTLPGDVALGSVKPPSRGKTDPTTSTRPSYLQETQTSRRKAIAGYSQEDKPDPEVETPKTPTELEVREFGPPQTLPPIHAQKTTGLQARDYSKEEKRHVSDKEFEQIKTSCKYISRPGDDTIEEEIWDKPGSSKGKS